MFQEIRSACGLKNNNTNLKSSKSFLDFKAVVKRFSPLTLKILQNHLREYLWVYVLYK